MSDTRARAEIQLAAEPRPWTPRAAISTPTEWVSATRTDPAATSSEARDQQLAPADGVGGAAQRQREQRDRDRVGGERDADRLVAGPGARLDLRQQRGDQPEQRGVDRDRADRDRGDRAAPRGASASALTRPRFELARPRR